MAAREAEVAVIGGGVVGCAVARALARAARAHWRAFVNASAGL